MNFRLICQNVLFELGPGALVRHSETGKGRGDVHEVEGVDPWRDVSHQVLYQDPYKLRLLEVRVELVAKKVQQLLLVLEIHGLSVGVDVGHELGKLGFGQFGQVQGFEHVETGDDQAEILDFEEFVDLACGEEVVLELGDHGQHRLNFRSQINWNWTLFEDNWNFSAALDYFRKLRIVNFLKISCFKPFHLVQILV